MYVNSSARESALILIKIRFTFAILKIEFYIFSVFYRLTKTIIGKTY